MRAALVVGALVSLFGCAELRIAPFTQRRVAVVEPLYSVTRDGQTFVALRLHSDDGHQCWAENQGLAEYLRPGTLVTCAWEPR